MKSLKTTLGLAILPVLLATGIAHSQTIPLAIDPTSLQYGLVTTAALPATGNLGGGFSFYDATYAAANPTLVAAAGAFPNLTATGVSGNVYDFAANGTNDSIIGGGTLTLATPTAGLSSVIILGTAANGSATGDVTLTFAGGATATGSVSFGDWGGNDGDINGLGRETGGSQSAGLQFALFDPSVSIPVADQSLALVSVTYTSTSNGNVAIFALDGTVATTPEPSTWAMMLIGVGALTLVARRRLS